MKLNAEEQAMRDGDGKPGADARQMAMDLLVRYGEALDAERLVDTNNVAGTSGSSSIFIRDFYAKEGALTRDQLFSRFDLDSDQAADEIPNARTFTCHLQTRIDPAHGEMMGTPKDTLDFHLESQNHSASLGVQLLNTCTPYANGNVPVMGEHCAWMESSAVVYCNSVLGARTNTEGCESTASAMLTGKIPYWGFHLDENRFGRHQIDVDVEMDSVMDWGMLGYFTGDAVEEEIPVLTGIKNPASLIRHKHFGAAGASSGGVEMYHVVGQTPEAATIEQAFGPNKPAEIFRYGTEERRRTYETINANGHSDDMDYVMLGCPHYTIEQIWEASKLLAGKRIHDNCALWIFTARGVKDVSDKNGYTKIIEDAGGVIMTDTCSAMSAAVPKGTKVAATDSAKQTHYLPAITGVEAWFGSTEDCVNAAVTGKWKGEAP
ncbi:MAG: aconitase X catalytic domain-containing protein [Rhodospirillales bacterium]|nr:aconitase X catalytic domain-containing protein [Rhodospirillales bacterium]